MKNMNEHNITAGVLATFAGCDNPRLREIMSSLVTHLHDFVRETRLSEAEWLEGIKFLTATGQKCDDKRQEFILLSDTLGISMLNIAINNAKPAGATEATVFGPFHLQDAPRYELGADIANGAKGEKLRVEAIVKGLDGKLIAGAEVDVWQVDEDGMYDAQYAELGHTQARGVLRSDREGRVYFDTVMPVSYPIPTDGPVGSMLVALGRHPWRPAHVHFMIKAPGYEHLITHVFVAGDSYIESDAVFGVRYSLISKFEHLDNVGKDQPAGAAKHRLTFEFVLNPIP